jgi:hypothetical protein
MGNNNSGEQEHTQHTENPGGGGGGGGGGEKRLVEDCYEVGNVHAIITLLNYLTFVYLLSF